MKSWGQSSQVKLNLFSNFFSHSANCQHQFTSREIQEQNFSPEETFLGGSEADCWEIFSVHLK